jgi:hypothetical protein
MSRGEREVSDSLRVRTVSVTDLVASSHSTVLAGTSAPCVNCFMGDTANEEWPVKPRLAPMLIGTIRMMLNLVLLGSDAPTLPLDNRNRPVA